MGAALHYDTEVITVQPLATWIFRSPFLRRLRWVFRSPPDASPKNGASSGVRCSAAIKTASGPNFDQSSTNCDNCSCTNNRRLANRSP